MHTATETRPEPLHPALTPAADVTATGPELEDRLWVFGPPTLAVFVESECRRQCAAFRERLDAAIAAGTSIRLAMDADGRALLDGDHLTWLTEEGPNLPTPPRSTEFFYLDEYERNGRDDSDWFTTIFHLPTRTIFTMETGTTRFAEAIGRFDAFLGRLSDAPADVVIAAQDAWAKAAAESLVLRDTHKVLEPAHTVFSFEEVPVRFLRTCSLGAKSYTAKVCPKCNGTGEYRTARGLGDCYTCNGRGRWETFGKTEPKKTRIEAGTRAVAVRPAEFFGTCYRGGYNQPSRSNTRVLVRLEDGRHVTAAVEALRLDREPCTFEEKHPDMLAASRTMGPGSDRWGMPGGHFHY